MPRYRYEGIETRTYDVVYIIIADTPEEAREKFKKGETYGEQSPLLREIIERTPWGEPEELK